MELMAGIEPATSSLPILKTSVITYRSLMQLYIE